MFGFIKRIVLGQKKMYLVMTMVLSLLFAFTFILLSMYTIANSMERTVGQTIILVTGMTALLILVVVLYINTFFIESKTDEFSMVLLSGRNTLQILKYIIIQFGLLFLITAILGAGIGYGIMIGLEQILGSYNNPIFTSVHYIEALGMFVAIVVVNLCYVLLLNYSKFNRIKMSIADYMNHVDSDERKINFFSQFSIGGGNRKLPVGKLLITGLALVMLIYCIMEIITTNGTSDLMGYYVLTLFSEIVILTFTLPLVYDFLHDRYLLKKPIVLHALNQLMNITKVMISVMYMNAIAIPLIFTRFLDTSLNTEAKTIIICVYFILLSMVLLCFVIRFFIYLPSKANTISVLYAIGYNQKQIYSIQHKEILGFILFIVGLPLLIYGGILYRVYHLQLLTMDMVMLLAGSYIVLYVIISGFMVSSYKTLAKGVFTNVKDINRSK